jgi:catechol 2,3-dioxygenase-like lactoylglutathione lyase family enzyme
MRIYMTSVLVDDQAQALDFYTQKLGFEVKNDIPMGEHRWLTVVSKEQPGGTELLLEPSSHRSVQPFKKALVAASLSPHSRSTTSTPSSPGSRASASNSPASRWMQGRRGLPSSMTHAAT